MADRQFSVGGVLAAPAAWVLPDALDIVMKTAYASYDGSGAAGAFIPCLRIISDSGHVASEIVAPTEYPAGASVDVSWFRGLAASASSGSSGSGPAVIYDSTATASIAGFGTGAGGVPATHRDILIVTYLRTSEAIEATFDCQVNFNGDFAGTYKDGRIHMTNTTIIGQIDSPGGLASMSAAGNTADVGMFAPNFLYVPNYQRVGTHVAIGLQGVTSRAGSSTNWNLGVGVHSYTTTNPITQIDVIPNVGGGGLFVAGSRCTIYGLG
jgi:hypothetical protein